MLHDALLVREWMLQEQDDYRLTPKGIEHLTAIGLDLTPPPQARRRFAFPCLDWSQRCAHIGGTLGAALLEHMVRDKWLVRALDSRALTVTPKGCKRLASVFDIQLET